MKIIVIAPFIAIFTSFLLSCDNLTLQVAEDLVNQGAASTYQGCLTAEPINATTVRVNFVFPISAERVTVFRDGIQVFTANSPSANAYIDSDLVPGHTVTYNCDASVGSEVWLGQHSVSITPVDPLSNYKGCVDGRALGASEIEVAFEFPDVADQVSVLRNGVEVYSNSADNRRTLFVDTNLKEGQTYEYRCLAKIDDYTKQGSSILSIKTLSTNPPIFAGIRTAIAQSTSSVNVTWGVVDPTSVSASYFKIYAAVGNTIDWEDTAAAITVPAGSLKTLLTGLGDELPYTFGVRACTADDVCDTNTATESLTLGDGGAAKTPGITQAVLKNGEIELTAPWLPEHGAVAKRRVYQRIGATGGSNLADYTLIRTIAVSDLTNPDTLIKVSGLNGNATYHFIVQDEDPSENNNNNTAVATVTTGDLVRPAFSGITAIAKGPAGLEETALVVSFTAIAKESDDPDGASHYLFYTKSGGGDACTSGSLTKTIASGSYTAGTSYNFTLSGLTARTLYSVCIKARDSAGNISNTTAYLSKQTLDKTPPVFDGIQSLTYDNAQAQLLLGWNASPSSDVFEYKLELWKNSVVPGLVTTLARSHTSYANGAALSAVDFSFVDDDVVYVLVQACDNAATIPDGTQNCTTFAYAAAKVLQIPDATPPANFVGIKGPNDLTLPAQGEVTVSWYAPASWTDYRGFKIYQVDPNTNDLTPLKECPCSGNDCPNQITSCTVSGLVAYQTYYFHVRAYDAAGNLTAYLDPATNRSVKRTSDTQAPSFTSSLTLNYNSGANSLGWNAATDNQSAEGSLTYNIYRKAGTSFADAMSPSTDGTLIGNISTTSYVDNDLVSGTMYNYTVCAKDSSGNLGCDGNVRSALTPDVDPPSITALATDKTEVDKSWKLTWSMSDAVTTTSNLLVYVRRSESVTPETPSSSNSVWWSGVGATELPDLTGPVGVDRYINYLITVVDEAGNEDSESISVFSQNAIAIISLQRAEGSTAGGKLLVINGTGFVDGASVTIGGVACANPKVYLPTKMGCITPAHSAGPVDVIVTNTDGSSATATGGYNYCDPISCTSSCDKPSSWGSSFARGDGNSFDPYLICTAQHWQNINSIVRYKTFEVGDNIDLSVFTDNSYVPIYSSDAQPWFFGNIIGNNYTIANLTYNDPLKNHVGAFGQFSGGTQTWWIKNLDFHNFNLTGQDYVGIVSAQTENTMTTLFENITVSGNVSGRNNVGGVIGRAWIPLFRFVKSYASVSATGDYAGGLSGRGGEITDSFAMGDVSGVNYVGGLVGANGYSYNSFATGDVTGTQHVGGLSGGSLHSVNSYATGNVSGVTNVGGLAGGSANATNSYATGGVTGTNYVGGALGADINSGLGKCNQCFASGTVSGTQYVGGLAGRHDGLVTRSFTANRVTATGNQVGGLLGAGWGGKSLIKESFTTGDVVGQDLVAGLAGYIYQTHDRIENTYSTASVHGRNNIAGLLVASTNSSGSLQFTNSYAAGHVTATSGASYTSGFYVSSSGTNPAYAPQVLTNNYWDTQATGQNTSDFSAVNQIEGKTTAQMQTQSIFVGWDFTNTWVMESGSYPKLRWQKEAWAAGYDHVTCSGSGGSKTVRIFLMNHDQDTPMTISANAITVNDGGTVIEDGCSGETLKAVGGSCSFKVSYTTTATTSNTDITVGVEGADFYDVTITPDEVNNSCP